jgi:hypothetical protein
MLDRFTPIIEQQPYPLLFATLNDLLLRIRGVPG